MLASGLDMHGMGRRELHLTCDHMAIVLALALPPNMRASYSTDCSCMSSRHAGTSEAT